MFYKFARLFCLPVTGYHVSEWISLELGQLKQTGTNKKGMPIMRGEYRIFLKAMWQVIQDGNLVAERGQEDKEHLHNSPALFLGSTIKCIELTDDKLTVSILFSNGSQLIGHTSVPESSTWTYFSIE